MTGTPLVEMRDICVSVGCVHAVDHVTVDLNPGEVVGLLGHNGPGKSTPIKVLSGACRADSGESLTSGDRAATRSPRGCATLCDRVSVMKNGRLVGTVRVEDVTEDDILGMIILGKRPTMAMH
jgi:ABC-type sugar transport system ATPase subunit